MLLIVRQKQSRTLCIKWQNKNKMPKDLHNYDWKLPRKCWHWLQRTSWPEAMGGSAFTPKHFVPFEAWTLRIFCLSSFVDIFYHFFIDSLLEFLSYLKWKVMNMNYRYSFLESTNKTDNDFSSHKSARRQRRK